VNNSVICEREIILDDDQRSLRNLKWNQCSSRERAFDAVFSRMTVSFSYMHSIEHSSDIVDPNRKLLLQEMNSAKISDVLLTLFTKLKWVITNLC